LVLCRSRPDDSLPARQPADTDRQARFAWPAELSGSRDAPDASVWPDKQALLTKNRAHSRLRHRVNALHVRLADLKINVFSDQSFTALPAEISRWR
jgi:hypothetical protein